jgi:carotenoid cleavage dioxygenase
MAGKRRIRFDKEQPARFGVIPRRGSASDIKWFNAEGCYVYHTINAYEDGDDDVVVVGCRVRDLIPAQPDTSGAVAKLDSIELVPHLYRWRFNMKSGAVKEEQLDDTPTEFPRANDARMGTRLRWSYNPRIARDAVAKFDAVIKYDLDSGKKAAVHEYERGWFGSEVTFVPAGAAEDDGFLVTLITKAGERSRALVLDARSLQQLAQVALPQQVPIGFHTAWVPASSS